ncbi:TPA: hypothetical protein O4G82_000355 [Staphylococcus aureus]|nr:hypothetical protein [Staphylococcus aureus]
MTLFDMPNYLWITTLIMSLLISFLLWYFTRNWRKERKARKLEKQIEKYGYEGAELRRKDKK